MRDKPVVVLMCEDVADVLAEARAEGCLGLVALAVAALAALLFAGCLWAAA